MSKWTSQNGTGDMIITLLVRNIEGDVTRADLLAAERAGDWDWLLPPEFTLIDGKVVELDREPGTQADMSGTGRALDLEVEQNVRSYTIFPSGKMVQIMCMSQGDVNDGGGGERKFGIIRDLCRQVALSVTFPDSYR